MDLGDPFWMFSALFDGSTKSTDTLVHQSKPSTSKKEKIIEMQTKAKLDNSNFEPASHQNFTQMKTFVHDIISNSNSTKNKLPTIVEEPSATASVSDIDDAAAAIVKVNDDADVDTNDHDNDHDHDNVPVTVIHQKNDNDNTAAAQKVRQMNTIITAMDRDLMLGMQQEKTIHTKRYRFLKIARKLLRMAKCTITAIISSMGLTWFVMAYMMPFIGIDPTTFKMLFSSVLWVSIKTAASALTF